MTAVDYSRHRNYLARKRQQYAPGMKPGEIASRMEREGYPASPQFWGQLMSRTAPTKHIVIALARVWGVTVDDVMPEAWFRTLDDCHAKRCTEHGI